MILLVMRTVHLPSHGQCRPQMIGHEPFMVNLVVGRPLHKDVLWP